jgi:Protein of unknown function (DUF1579)
MANRLIIFLIATLGMGIATARYTMATEPAITTYGQRNAQAPSQLNLFSFLVGKWRGTGKTKLADGSSAQFELTWIGRYILNGMAIADEFHSLAPDGSPYLGISIRHFDAKHHSWIIEYLNVSNSFLRRQVNPQSGSVCLDAGTIVVISEDAQTRIRENYRVADHNHFTYSTDMSHDGGRSWDPVSIDMTLERVE